MNKNLIAGLIIGGVLVLGGAGWYYATQNSDDGSTSSTFSAEEITDFLNPYDRPVTMTATITDPANPDSEGTFSMQFEDEDTWSMTMKTEEGDAQIIYDGGFSYMQNPEDGSWLKIPAGDDIDSPADNFKISEEDMEDFRTNAVSTGTSECSLGTCTTFDYIDPVTGETATMKIGSDGRIAEIVAISGTSTITMAYDYDASVDIQIPANAQEFDIPL